MTKRLISINDVPAAGSRLPDDVQAEIAELVGDGSWTTLDDRPAALVTGPNTANGYLQLDGTGKAGSAQLPSYVDDVLEFANFAALPGTGVAGVIYVTLDTNFTWRWGGSSYVQVDQADVAALIHAATSKTTPVDADELGLVDSAASNVLKRLTWANLKAALKTYFDSLVTTLSGKTLTSPKIVNNDFIADGNGNEVIVIGQTASAVNEIKVTNAATGNNPSVAAQGGDTNVGLNVITKGTGPAQVNGNQIKTGSQAVLTTTSTLGAVSGHEYMVLLGTSGLPTLPTAVGNTSRYIIKNTTGSAINIATTSAQTIEGAAAPFSLPAGASITLVSDNANWWFY